MEKRDTNRPADAVLTPEEIAALTRAPDDEPEPLEEPFGWDTAPVDPDAARLEPGGGLDVIAGGGGDARLVGPGDSATVVESAPVAEPAPGPTATAGGVDVISLRAGGEKWVPAEAAQRGAATPERSGGAGLAPILARLHRIQAHHALLGKRRRQRKGDALS